MKSCLDVSKMYLIFCKALIKCAFITLKKKKHDAVSTQYESEKLDK